MRLLTYTSLFPNKVEPDLGVFIYQRMSHFARREGSVEVVAPVPYAPGWLPWLKAKSAHGIPQQEQIGNLRVHHPRYLLLPKVSMPLHGLSMFLGSYRLVKRLHAEAGFDCIDAHYVYPDGFAAVLLGRALKIPVIVSARGTDMNLFPSFLLIRPMIRWTLERVAGGIGVCTPLVEVMLANGLAPDRAQVIGNGIDVERFRPVELAVARARLKLPSHRRIAVAVGGLIPRKGFHLLIPAVAEVKKAHPDLMLYIIGKGPESARLEEMTRSFAVQDSVFFVGAQPNSELQYWYSAADVSCLTSSREGWPNVILESMACGTPVVATKVWGTPEVVVSSELGVMVEQNVASISQGLDTALRRAWNRRSIAEYARQRTWDVVAQEVEQFLVEAVAKNKTTDFFGRRQDSVASP